MSTPLQKKKEIDGPPLRSPGFICIDGPEGVRGDDRVVQTLLEFFILLFIPADYFFFSLRLPLALLLRFDGRKNRRNITRPGLLACWATTPKKFQTTIVKFLTAFNFIFLIYFGVSVGYYLAVQLDWSVSFFLQKEKMATVTLLLRFILFFFFKDGPVQFFQRMEREWKNLLEKLEELPVRP